ncbi:berberine bridge enzyme-like 13 [Abeliophyllum distichum]|uniref:Berberine bridge enzyme-like 13 n=1 Tax=Abeliophyllum distichum TaxID=126358 RepID=A0ABD1ULM3_9LAMI
MNDEIFISQKPTDTINLSTLIRMKIVKEQGQWVAKTKGCDTESTPSMLPFEGDGAMRDDSQDKEDAPPLSPPRDIPRSNFSSSSSGFTFSKDLYNLMNGRINSLTSTIYGLQNLVDGLTSLLQQVLASQQALNTRFDMVFPPSPHPEH